MEFDILSNNQWVYAQTNRILYETLQNLLVDARSLNHLVSPFLKQINSNVEIPHVRLIQPPKEFAIHLNQWDLMGKSLLDKAIYKARLMKKLTDLPVLAEETTLIVPILNGNSYDIAHHSIIEAENELNQLLDDLMPYRIMVPFKTIKAHYISVMAFICDDYPLPIVSQGITDGEILPSLEGKNVFTYDGVFWVPEFGSNMAELSLSENYEYGYRGEALQALFMQLLPNI